MSGPRLRHLVRLRVEKSDGVRPLLTLDRIESGSGMVAGEIPDGKPEGQIRFEPGDVLFSKLRPYLAKSLLVREPSHGTGELLAMVPSDQMDARFLLYTTLSKPWLDLADLTSYGTKMPRTSWEAMADYRFPDLPLEVQRRIADFLDDQTTRIDNIITARKRQIDDLAELRIGLAIQAIRGDEYPGPRKYSRLPWLGDIPRDWPTATVNAAYEVVLGKMLDESKFTGAHPVPYLRNTNVQWDRIDIEDVKVMDIRPFELERFTVRGGDLLVCEGGQPGRAAVWDGRIKVMGFQKALHRARPRRDDRVEWLQNFLRVAVAADAFGGEREATTIGHLTNEQLRSQRLPMPPVTVQDAALRHLHRRFAEVHTVEASLVRDLELLAELKRSLVSAAVSGEFDVSSADGSRVVA